MTTTATTKRFTVTQKRNDGLTRFFVYDTKKKCVATIHAFSDRSLAEECARELNDLEDWKMEQK